MGFARVIVLLSLWSFSSSATVYSSFLENGSWTSNASVFECRLTHTVPSYGNAVFHTRAGETSEFYLEGDTGRLKEGKATLLARSPIWAEVRRQVEIGQIPMVREKRAVQLPSATTERMLSELYSGQELVIAYDPWYGSEDPLQLAITTVGFRAAYDSYLTCLAGLLPVNFDQIRRTSIYYASGQVEELQLAERRKLDNIVAYVKADPSVREFFIDGHTDSVGTREVNLAVAQKRAEQVTNYLIKKGVPKEAITSRWHGERYPIASNETPAGRAKNRRVTIRLERVTLED